jgi:hypothetical protein
VPTFVVGDVHGHIEPLIAVLRDAGLVDEHLAWSGADARVWFIGDLVDRGPDGIGAVDLVMRLGREGDVRCLLGNHEAGLIGAHRFAAADCGVPGMTFEAVWELNGGTASDLARLRPEHVAWMECLPAVARDGNWLLVHSDTDRYLEYGTSVESICSSISAIVAGSDRRPLAHLLDALADRGAFADPDRLQRLLSAFDCERVVHGHTPIWYTAGMEPLDVTGPLVYAGGRALNVDHCLFAGGLGFIAELSL